jgi:hypothetical protein
MKRRGRGNGGRRRRGEDALRRRSQHRPERIRILIVCEGRETEPNYFRGVRDEESVRQRFVVAVRKGKGRSRVAVVEQAVAEMQKAETRGEAFDQVWCVLDVEQADKRAQVLQARTLAGQHGIRLALSNPCFECWPLAHFVRTKRSFTGSDPVIAELNKHWRGEFGRDYEKNDQGLYACLAGRTRTAIDNARNVRTRDWATSADILDCNSATDVFLLVERLLAASE